MFFCPPYIPKLIYHHWRYFTNCPFYVFLALPIFCQNQWRSDRGAGGAGRTGRHLLKAAKGRKTPKIKKSHVKIQIVSFICVCVQEKQSVTASVYLSLAITLGTALQFQKPKTKGRQIWPPPWVAKGPATPLVRTLRCDFLQLRSAALYVDS